MTLRGFFKSWNDFFFKPQSPVPVCLFRIFYGVIVLANLLMLRPEWLMWYGPHAFVSLDTMHKLSRNPTSMNLLELLPQTALAVNVFFWVFLLCTVSLTVGFMSRFSAVAVYLCLGSIQLRNGYILNSGDTLMMVCGFFLMFSPLGAAFSVDRWLRIRRGRAEHSIPLCAPWAQRMLQIQTAVVYLATFYWKSMGTLWMNGTAVYYALHLEDFHRFPIPPLHSMFLIKTLTWTTLAIEFALAVLVWFKELRYPVLLAGLCLHVGIEYAMNIPLFEWMIVATYVNFIYPEDISRAWTWTRAHFDKLFKRTAPAPAVEKDREAISGLAIARDNHA
jgi:hypothetical protein